MIVYIDLDSTVFNYRAAYTGAHFEETGKHIDPTDEELIEVGYHMNELFGISEEDKYNYLTEDFFAYMTPYENAIDTISEIHQMDIEIRFVTHLVTDYAYRGKVKSLKKKFDWFEPDHHLICMKDKHLLIPGIIIDDNPTVIESSKGHHVVVKYNQPWNKHVTTDYSVSGWGMDMFNMITGITQWSVKGA